MTIYHLFSIILVFHFFSCSVDRSSAQENSKPNILFIAIDDLRPELGCYGNEHIKSPNIDKLASQGYLFKNHFVNVPTCGASRHAMLTGQLPVSRAHIKNSITSTTTALQEEQDIPETFIHQLKRSGYYTVGIGKITHHPDGYVYGYLDPASNQLELPYSWDEMLLDDEKWGSGHNAFFGYANGTNRNTLNKEVKPYEMADGPDEVYPDGLTSNLAITKLRELNKRDQPFFLGVGFFKPHLPFTAPKKYWDMYEEKNLPIAPFAAIPENSSAASLHKSGELNQYKLGEEKASLDGPVSDEYARKLRHAYFACVSYIDAQVGKVLAELKALDLDENTIIVLWGDHGWHLGDHLVWGKHTVFERSLNSAFIMKMPHGPGGKTIDQVVSSTDIYPTLMQLCRTPVKHSLDGQSLVNLMDNPDSKDWRNTAYGYFKNGISVRTDRYRLNRYYRKEIPEFELYDHAKDPNETINIASKNPNIVNELLPVLEKGNTGLFSK